MEQINLDLSNEDQIKKTSETAAEILKNGGTVIYPTDTLYALGASAFDEDTIIRVFKIKKRDRNKPMLVIVKDIKMARKIACIDSKVEKMLNSIWPGPITAVLRKKDAIPYILTANGETVAVRIPENKFISFLMEKISFPVIATSANISGENDLLSPEDIIRRFSKEEIAPDLFINVGPLANPAPSTIIDLTAASPKILRIGVIGKDKIKEFFDKFNL